MAWRLARPLAAPARWAGQLADRTTEGTEHRIGATGAAITAGAARATVLGATDALAQFGVKVHTYTHLSHIYAQGSSVYTTFVWPMAPDYETNLERWKSLKHAVSEAIVNNGGSADLPDLNGEAPTHDGSVSAFQFNFGDIPAGEERWAGVVDAVGSHTLANALAQTRYGGAVAACGLAQASDLLTTVLPFILRGVTLCGIDSVMAPLARRQAAWERLARELPPALLESMLVEVPLDQAIDQADALMTGQVRGRVVVRIDH